MTSRWVDAAWTTERFLVSRGRNRFTARASLCYGAGRRSSGATVGERRGWTQGELASRSSLKPNTVGAVLRGDPTSTRTLTAIAAGFGVGVAASGARNPQNPWVDERTRSAAQRRGGDPAREPLPHPGGTEDSRRTVSRRWPTPAPRSADAGSGRRRRLAGSLDLLRALQERVHVAPASRHGRAAVDILHPGP